MKNELCFFLETPKQIVGTQQLLLQLASYIAETTQIPTYFINGNIAQYGKDAPAKLTLCDIDNFDFAQHGEATYVTTTSYLFYLLARIGDCKNAKVFCISNYAGVYDALLKQIDAVGTDPGSIMRLLNDASACAYVNRESVEEVRPHVPNAAVRFVVEIGTGAEPEPYCAPKEPDTERIHVGWYGAITNNSCDAFKNLLDDLKALPSEQKIDVHIVGDGNRKWDIDYSVYAPRVRFVFGPLMEDERSGLRYLKENADVIFSYGPSAVRAAAQGVPTVVMPLVSEQDDRYVFFSELTLGELSPDVVWRRSKGMVLHTVEDVIDSADKKVAIGADCYKYCVDRHSIRTVSESFLEMLSSGSLTVGDCMSNPLICGHMDAYRNVKNKGKVSSYAEYHEYVRGKKLPLARRMLMKLRTFISTAKPVIKEKFPWLLQLKRRITYLPYLRIQKGYKAKLERISQKARAEGKIKVAFILVFNSVFPTRPVFEAMLNSERFDPYIIIAPNVSRGHRYQMQVYNEALSALTQQYPGRVIGGYREQFDEYYELKDEYPIVFFCNPYPKLVNRVHALDYFLDKDVLTIYSNYGFAALKFWDEVLSSDFYNKVWLTCIETETNLKYLKKHQQISGMNGAVTGYLKMDKMGLYTPQKKERKLVIVSPHHTVWGWSTLDIGNFLKYCDYFKELPARYPQVDFVFRPHPLLFSNLIAHKLWTQEQIDRYIAEMEGHPNAKYDKSGDYMELFANSDAMIHDCGSFIGEYLYTEKPCCYMLKNEAQARDGLVPLGQKCMENYYKAYSADDITKFIDDVVLGGHDPLKQQREHFSRTELKFNYPHATQDLIQMLERKIF